MTFGCIEEYIKKYARTYNLSIEEAKKHKMVKNVEEYYNSSKCKTQNMFVEK